jgi:capsular polysaccharide export protein
LPRRIGVITPGVLHDMAAAAWLPALLAPSEVHLGRAAFRADALVGWGKKQSSAFAKLWAKLNGIPFFCLEDAFLRSEGIGRSTLPLGVVIDDEGIYYDSRKPSRLEKLIARPLDTVEKMRAEHLIRQWQQFKVTKYNPLRNAAITFPDNYVLVTDQTAGDLSVVLGNASASHFSVMLDAALDENPGAIILLKTHPEVIAGLKKGYLSPTRHVKDTRVKLLATDVHPADLIANACKVYTVTSQIGFEALIWGKPVRVFGSPFYAGWGLTLDSGPRIVRRQQASLAQLVHASLVDYARYANPNTGLPCEVEDIIRILGRNQNAESRLEAGPLQSPKYPPA